MTATPAWFGPLASRGLPATIGIEIIELTPERVVATMPVDERTRQPFGLLHGGASLALAETVASLGAAANVDELYRFALALDAPDTFVRDTASANDSDGEMPTLDTRLGWHADRHRGTTRLAEYSVTSGSHAFVRFPERRAVVIILTSGGTWDARSIAERIADRLLFSEGATR